MKLSVTYSLEIALMRNLISDGQTYENSTTYWWPIEPIIILRIAQKSIGPCNFSSITQNQAFQEVYPCTLKMMKATNPAVCFFKMQ